MWVRCLQYKPPEGVPVVGWYGVPPGDLDAARFVDTATVEPQDVIGDPQPPDSPASPGLLLVEFVEAGDGDRAQVSQWIDVTRIQKHALAIDYAVKAGPDNPLRVFTEATKLSEIDQELRATQISTVIGRYGEAPLLFERPVRLVVCYGALLVFWQKPSSYPGPLVWDYSTQRGVLEGAGLLGQFITDDAPKQFREFGLGPDMVQIAELPGLQIPLTAETSGDLAQEYIRAAADSIHTSATALAEGLRYWWVDFVQSFAEAHASRASDPLDIGGRSAQLERTIDLSSRLRRSAGNLLPASTPDPPRWFINTQRSGGSIEADLEDAEVVLARCAEDVQKAVGLIATANLSVNSSRQLGSRHSGESDGPPA
jgi:hypothetical protein